ncbi:hypothetical protein EG339_09495 [Chryseobacterium bernardetii]|uniref:Uncharacterized protein n=1 Tax=Chryseobacterium bernardetii TaxID=1241978 RepID=A0A3G6T646_9FLAO|nr:hypothetical protein EG339_09495 [Chryseobacterium bernardetii]
MIFGYFQVLCFIYSPDKYFTTINKVKKTKKPVKNVFQNSLSLRAMGIGLWSSKGLLKRSPSLIKRIRLPKNKLNNTETMINTGVMITRSKYFIFDID